MLSQILTDLRSGESKVTNKLIYIYILFINMITWVLDYPICWTFYSWASKKNCIHWFHFFFFFLRTATSGRDMIDSTVTKDLIFEELFSHLDGNIFLSTEIMVIPLLYHTNIAEDAVLWLQVDVRNSHNCLSNPCVHFSLVKEKKFSNGYCCSYAHSLSGYG